MVVSFGRNLHASPSSSVTSLAIIGAVMAMSQNDFSFQKHLPMLVLSPLVLIRKEVQLCGHMPSCSRRWFCYCFGYVSCSAVTSGDLLGCILPKYLLSLLFGYHATVGEDFISVAAVWIFCHEWNLVKFLHPICFALQRVSGHVAFGKLDEIAAFSWYWFWDF